jgi:Dolichyl-phosphate-mannose-protein mannosyltransferase
MSSLAGEVHPTLRPSDRKMRPNIDGELWLLFAALTAFYVLAIVIGGRRFVWFDELFTFDIARAATLSRLWEMIRRFDCNPPTSYLLSRVSMAILGQNSWGLRLPSMVEFYLGSAAIFAYVRRKVGAPFAALSTIFLWTSGAFFYAVEARPYALLFMFCGFLLLAWDRASNAQGKRKLALWAVALSTLGMFSAHAFAPFSLFPFLVAETVRWARRGRPDYQMWAALLLPTFAMIFYIPLFQTYKLILFPQAFQASPSSLVAFYRNSIEGFSGMLMVALLAALLVFPSRALLVKRPVPRLEDLALLAGFLLSPVLLTLALMRREGAFWYRYGITTQVAICAALAIFLGNRFFLSRRVAYTMTILMLFVFVSHDLVRAGKRPGASSEAALTLIRPDLPLVDASELTFFEMNHYESPSLLSRLYYLRDRAAAVKFAHATMFEDFEPPDLMRPLFPITANVDNYRAFVGRHHQFLVFATEDYPEDWLLPKLHADGAQLTQLGTFPGPYKDSSLYLVTIPPGL